MASDAPRTYRPVRTPTVLQMEAAECGAAALGIILEYHGRYVPLDVLRSDCGVSRDGSNAFYIKEAARHYGLETRAFRKDAEGLRNRQPPFMVLWQWNHFLVVEGFRRGLVDLNDPAQGRRTVSFDEFSRNYSGIALTFTPGEGFTREGRRPSTVRGLARRLRTSRAALAFVILAGLVLTVPTLVAAAYQRVFVDEILVQGRTLWLKPLLLALGLTLLVRLAATGLQQVHLTRLEIRLGLTESVRFLRHLLRLPVAFYQQRFAGDIVSRIASTARVGRLISGELATTAVSLLTLVFLAAAMLPHDPLLTGAGVAIGSLNLVALRWLGRWRTDQNRSIEHVRGRLWSGIMGAIQGIESVKAGGSESDLMVRWTGDQARVLSGEQRLGEYDSLLIALPPFLASITTVVVLWLGGRQVAAGTLTIGALVAFQALLASFNQPFRDLARMGSQLQELRSDLDRIDDVENHLPDPILSVSSSLGPPREGPTHCRHAPGSPGRSSCARSSSATTRLWKSL